MVGLFSKEISKSLSKKSPEFVVTYVPIDLVIRFPQVRETFDPVELQELADDIANDDVIQPSTVFRFSRKDFLAYVDIQQKMLKKKIDTANMPFERDARGQKWYYVLIAGERRFRAHKLLWEDGCTSCKECAQKKQAKLTLGECYKVHPVLRYGKVKVNIGINQRLDRAKSIQFRENLYVKPPIDEEAHALRNYYDYLKQIEKGLTIPGFARRVGFSPERVKKAIWFCDLPDKIKLAVKAKLISYGNALEVYRFTQAEQIDLNRRMKIVDEETDYLLMNPRIKVEDYKVRVKNIIESFQSLSLFDLNELTMGKKEKRRVVEHHSIQALLLYSHYVGKVSLLQKQGVIGKGKIFSEESPQKRIEQILQDIQRLSPLRKARILKLFGDVDQKTKPAS